MPTLRDSDIIEKIKLAYSERTSNGVIWKMRPAAEWVSRNLNADDYTPPDIDDLVYEHICSGGAIYAAEERREEFLHDKCHYDFHIPLPGYEKKLYIETTLREARMGPVVTVVNVHWSD
jgi:hypothetical protein